MHTTNWQTSNVRNKEKSIRSNRKIVHSSLWYTRRNPRDCRSFERGKFIFFLSFSLSLSLQRNVQWSSTTRPLMSRFSSFRVRTPNERFFPLLRHDTRLCRRKTIMYRHNKLFLPSSSCKPSFPPRLDLFSALHFLCIANRKRKRKRGEIFDEEKEKVDERGVDEGSKEIVRRKLNVGITRRFCYLWSSISSRLPALKFRENKETTPSIFDGFLEVWAWNRKYGQW